MKPAFYITTTTPYVNADPHIGFALEIIQADAVARYYGSKGYDVVFNTGTDEHGQKIYQKALEEGIDPKSYCDKYAERFKKLKDVLNLSYTNFIRTTDDYHKKAAQEFWTRCLANTNEKGEPDIYKANYKIKYCVGCELEKTDSELVDDRCPLHPKLNLEIREEENYFFRLSRYKDQLLELYKNNPDFVLPDFRQNEISSFVVLGLHDFSISRLKKKMPWGVDVPNDPDHVMYVWFDALVNYISTLGWPYKTEKFNRFWPGIQVAGKDNLRQQSAMWQAMLLSAKLPATKQIFIHGFITSEGKKMSKSLGNVISPVDLVKQYGIDAVRYYLLREIPAADDGDFSHNRMKELYNADLANELGNLVSRTTTLAEKFGLTFEKMSTDNQTHIEKDMNHFQLNQALEKIWLKIKETNKKMDELAPWQKDFKDFDSLKKLIQDVYRIADMLTPFLPDTAEKIKQAVEQSKKTPPLFPKLN